MVIIQFLKYYFKYLKFYFNKFLGHLGSPRKINDPELAITSEVITNIDAIENRIILDKDNLLFIISAPFLLLIGMLVYRLSIYHIQKKAYYILK